LSLLFVSLFVFPQLLKHFGFFARTIKRNKSRLKRRLNRRSNSGRTFALFSESSVESVLSSCCFLNVCVSLFVVYVRLFFVFLSSGGFSIFWGINTSLGIRFYKFSLRIKQIKTRRDNQAMYVSALFFYVFGNAGKHAKEMRF
jgi:hypothetical protein